MLIELEEVRRTVSLVLGKRGVKADDCLVRTWAPNPSTSSASW